MLRRRRRRRRGPGRCLGAESGWRFPAGVSRSNRASNRGSRKPPRPRSLPRAEPGCPASRPEMARPGSGRFSPSHYLDPYGSEPETAGGEGGCSSAPTYQKAGPRKGQRSRVPQQPRCPSSWQRHEPPAGEGYATSLSPSCTSLYRADCQGHPDSSGSGRGNRLEEVLREDQWASPVQRTRAYGPNFVSEASKPPSACASSSSFCQLENSPSKPGKKELKGRGWQEACESSPSLNDLMHSFARQYEDEDEDDTQAENHYHKHSVHHPQRRREPQVSLQDLTDKRYQDLIPERDRKIAALMLARHREEQDLKERQLQTSDAWDKMRRREKKLKSRLEKEKQHHLAESLEKWQREREHRKATLKLEEQQLLKAREKEMMLQDKKWEKLAQEQEMRQKEKLERTKFQAQYRKRCQEKQLREKRIAEKNAKQYNYNLLKEKMAEAFEKRLLKEMEGKKKRQDLNQYEKTRRRHLRAQMDHQVKADELYKRLSIEQKLQRSQEILDHLMEERNKELKEKSLRDEEQGLLAKFRAKETEEEKRKRKNMLLQIAEMKIQQAREIMSKNIQDKAQRSKDNNYLKEINHHFRKQKVEDDEKCHLQEIQEAIRRKDEKSNRILRDKEAAVEDSRKIAKASYDLREKVRELINSHSFD
ncbi:coiled-coil domain-containing protein 185-like [Emydura macquarii macquarii]|uniref:coiled-coil domain-containing protein 185-like n=1 Tax=Emydura macquarii macquarii TaxID=1129001 RepID=UPI00352AF051